MESLITEYQLLRKRIHAGRYLSLRNRVAPPSHAVERVPTGERASLTSTRLNWLNFEPVSNRSVVVSRISFFTQLVSKPTERQLAKELFFFFPFFSSFFKFSRFLVMFRNFFEKKCTTNDKLIEMHHYRKIVNIFLCLYILFITIFVKMHLVSFQNSNSSEFVLFEHVSYAVRK